MPARYKRDQKGSTSRWGRAWKTCLFIVITSVIVVSCGQAAPSVIPTLKNSPTTTSAVTKSTIIPTNTTQPTPSLAPTSKPVLVWLPDYLPDKMRNGITLPDGFEYVKNNDEADITLEVNREVNTTSQWVYALVAPFPTILDGVTSEELRNAWDGSPLASLNGAPLLMDESTRQVLNAYWGEPAIGAIQVFPKEELLYQAWSGRPAWAIIPFEELNPQWKVLAIDGISPIRKEFKVEDYFLTIPFTLNNKENQVMTKISIPAINWDASKLTTVAMTGVTAMVRATAFAMENYGVTYPAEDIGSLLMDADITHISNEIPFSPDCPFPEPVSSSLVFCSNPKYIDLLKAVGTDVVELTGDHFMDYGADATLYTLNLYDDLGWPYYGGGADAEKARQPVLFEINGNKIAFMGCNIGCEIKTAIPCTAIATEDHPGAAKCDFDWISSDIAKLREQGYQVIFTFQHIEYYKYTIEPILEQNFEQVAEAGAVIVSGSQAHQPHGFEFKNGAYIHYGLGNLFFDQYHFCAYYACDDAFIDHHVFYDGQYISTELITIHFIDYARPRLMNPEERANFLRVMFNASGW